MINISDCSNRWEWRCNCDSFCWCIENDFHKMNWISCLLLRIAVSTYVIINNNKICLMSSPMVQLRINHGLNIHNSQINISRFCKHLFLLIPQVQCQILRYELFILWRKSCYYCQNITILVMIVIVICNNLLWLTCSVWLKLSHV